MLKLKVSGQEWDRTKLLHKLVDMQYVRNDLAGTRATFRVRGDTTEVFPDVQANAVRVELPGDEVDALSTMHPTTGELLTADPEMYVFPALALCGGRRASGPGDQPDRDRVGGPAWRIRTTGQVLEGAAAADADQLRHRDGRQIGTCSGIENCSKAHRRPAKPTQPRTAYSTTSPEDFLLVIDESHVTVPQIGGMYEGDMSRKRTLVEHGFRLPSAMDNRPLRFEEFTERIGQTIYSSATPGPYEQARSRGAVEQIIRPTGLVDPEVIVKPTKGQIDDLMAEIRTRVDRDERVLVTTLTKKMAEDLTDYLMEHGVRTRYLHSEVDTLRRVELLRELRLGEYDVLVGINLLREGLDLPEVSLVAILDADKEGFLRSERSLIQTIGRAARNVSGQVHMYADRMTPSMTSAIDETNRRRAKQVAYNTANGIDPQPLRKRIADITDLMAREDADTEYWVTSAQGKGKGRGQAVAMPAELRDLDTSNLAAGELAALIQELTAQMHQAAGELQFELAARLRDEVADLKKELRQMVEATR